MARIKRNMQIGLVGMTLAFCTATQAGIIARDAVFPVDFTEDGLTDDQLRIGFNGVEGGVIVNSLAGPTTLSTNYSGSVAAVLGQGGSEGGLAVTGNGSLGSAEVDFSGKSVFAGLGAGSTGLLNVTNGGSTKFENINAGANGGTGIIAAVGYFGDSNQTVIDVADQISLGRSSGGFGIIRLENSTLRAGGGTVAGESDGSGAARIELNQGSRFQSLFLDLNPNTFLFGNGGTLQGALFGLGGTIAPGLSPGNLTVDGTADLRTGVLELEWDGLSAFDIFTVTEKILLGKDFQINLTLGALPTGILDLNQFLITPEISLQGFSFFENFSVSYGSGITSGVTQIAFNGAVRSFEAKASVSEPSLLALLSLGLIGLNFARRRHLRA
ncbi:MAG: hypothetical protein R3F50_17040 [Gammaproteobacteria bacterium]